MRTLGQNRRIWGLTNRLGAMTLPGIAKARMRAMCKQISGQDRTSKLGEKEADRLIRALEEEIERVEKDGQQRRIEDGTVTPDQNRGIEGLYQQLGWKKENQKIGFNIRIIKKPYPETSHEGRKIFEALKAMVMRKVDKDEVLQRIEEIINFTGDITDWEMGFIIDLKRRIEKSDLLSPMMVKKLHEIYWKRLKKKSEV